MQHSVQVYNMKMLQRKVETFELSATKIAAYVDTLSNFALPTKSFKLIASVRKIIIAVCISGLRLTKNKCRNSIVVIF